jgi:large subunit ribosomal protein L5
MQEMWRTALMKPRLKEKYENEISPALFKELKCTSIMQVPKISKITLNMGVGSAIQNPKELEGAANDLSRLSGQKSVITKAKKSIASFKLREGVAIGCMVTLRGDRMYEFLDRLLSVAIPRIRDFRGLSRKSFDSKGNYTFGVKEQTIFPEVDFESIVSVKGMNITIVSSAKTDDDALILFEKFGFPFRK